MTDEREALVKRLQDVEFALAALGAIGSASPIFTGEIKRLSAEISTISALTTQGSAAEPVARYVNGFVVQLKPMLANTNLYTHPAPSPAPDLAAAEQRAEAMRKALIAVWDRGIDAQLVPMVKAALRKERPA